MPVSPEERVCRKERGHHRQRGHTVKLVVTDGLCMNHYRSMICHFALSRRFVYGINQHIGRRVAVGVRKDWYGSCYELLHH